MQKQCFAKPQVVYHTLYLTSLAGFIAKLQILSEPLGAVQRTQGFLGTPVENHCPIHTVKTRPSILTFEANLDSLTSGLNFVKKSLGLG
jgi:hypothetical protein